MIHEELGIYQCPAAGISCARGYTSNLMWVGKPRVGSSCCKFGMLQWV